MSKGPGRIQRIIMAAFEAEADNAFTTTELCERAYGDVDGCFEINASKLSAWLDGKRKLLRAVAGRAGRHREAE